MTDDPPTDGELFRWAWGVVAVMLLGLIGMGAVGVYKMWLTTTVQPADDVPARGVR